MSHLKAAVTLNEHQRACLPSTCPAGPGQGHTALPSTVLEASKPHTHTQLMPPCSGVKRCENLSVVCRIHTIYFYMVEMKLWNVIERAHLILQVGQYANPTKHNPPFRFIFVSMSTRRILDKGGDFVCFLFGGHVVSLTIEWVLGVILRYKSKSALQMYLNVCHCRQGY